MIDLAKIANDDDFVNGCAKRLYESWIEKLKLINRDDYYDEWDSLNDEVKGALIDSICDEVIMKIPQDLPELEKSPFDDQFYEEEQKCMEKKHFRPSLCYNCLRFEVENAGKLCLDCKDVVSRIAKRSVP